MTIILRLRALFRCLNGAMPLSPVCRINYTLWYAGAMLQAPKQGHRYRQIWWRLGTLCLAGSILAGCIDGGSSASNARPRATSRPTARAASRTTVAMPPAEATTAAPTALPTPTFVPTVAPLPARLEVIYAGADGLHIRDAPNLTKVATLLKGSIVTVQGAPRDDGDYRWWPVGVESGWIAEGPRDAAQPRWLSPAEGGILDQSQAARVTYAGADGLNLRREAGPAGAIIVTLLEGSTLKITGSPQDIDGVRWFPARVAEGWIAEGRTDPAEPRWLAALTP